MYLLKPQRVTEIFVNCLFTQEEIKVNPKYKEEGVLVDGFMYKVLLNKNKIEKHLEEINNMIDCTHEKFEKGWTFLNFGYDKNEELWTGQQKVMHELMVLGMAIGRVDYCTIKINHDELDEKGNVVSSYDIMNLLPGNVPYIKTIRKEEKTID